MTSVWIVTRETGSGRHRTVIGVYREEWEARDRAASEEAKDEAVQRDCDVEEFDEVFCSLRRQCACRQCLGGRHWELCLSCGRF